MRVFLREVMTVRFKPDKQAVQAGFLALASIAASFAAGMLDTLPDPFDRIAFIVFRDLTQIILLGIVFPFILAGRPSRELISSGIRFDKPLRHLGVSTALGALLFLQFCLEPGTSFRPVDSNLLNGAYYVMVANVFEILFFGCFLRFRFERSLGIIPSIVVASGAFSLHHAGFQPEFGKLFLVGILFLSILRAANHWLVLFPLWWVGGLGDVLFRSPETIAVDWSGAWLWATMILATIVAMFVTRYPFRAA